MSLREVSGKRNDGSLLIDGGYVYNHDTLKNGNRYLKCSEVGCLSTGVVRRNESCVSVLRPHCHEPNIDEEQLAMYRHEIREKAADIHAGSGFRNVFDRESVRYPLGAVKRTFPADKQIMKRSRDKSIPPVPKDLDHLHDILNFQLEWRNLALAHNSPDEFFRETVLASDGSRVSVLVCPYMSDLLKKEGVNLAADATFDVRPQLPSTQQLLAIHAFETIHGRSYSWPCAYALMEQKSEAAYVAVFSSLNDAIGGNGNPGTLMGDYEKQLHNAAKKVHLNLRTSGCWFHYCNAVHGQACSLNLMDVCVANEIAERALLKCMALPLLPPGEIANGLHIIKEEIENANLSPYFHPLFKYIENEWLSDTKVGVDMLSVYELDVRTNNSVELGHFLLFKKINVKHPNFWVFYGSLKMYLYSQHLDRQRAICGLGIRNKRPQKSATQDTNIKTMQTQLAAGSLTVDSFLNRACHTAEGLQKRLKKHYLTVRNNRINLDDNQP